MNYSLLYNIPTALTYLSFIALLLLVGGGIFIIIKKYVLTVSIFQNKWHYHKTTK